MRSWLARYVVFPCHERLVRRATFRYLRELDEWQWLSPFDLRAVQQAKLVALLNHARQRTAFYRDRLSSAPADIKSLTTDRLLVDVPLLDKEQIRAHLDAMLWHEAPGGLFPAHTGGSSGEPLRFFLDRRRQAFDLAARLHTHRWFGVQPGDREVFLWGSPIEHRRTDGLRRLRDRLTNHLLLNAFDMSPARMDRYLDAMERFQPASLFGYPSSLALLAEHGLARKRRLKLRRLKAVFVTGEVCFPPHRAILKEYFSAPVADGYGSREAGFIAHECPQGSLHIMAGNCIVETVREGRPTRTGEAGEIVVTHLDGFGLPMIRYRTGDVGRLRSGRCACGRGLPLIDVVHGRVTDFLRLPDGTIRHALSIIYPLRETAGLRQFRVRQEADYSVIVQIVPHKMNGPSMAAEVARRVRPVVGEEIELRVEPVDFLPTEASGKYRYVISRAPEPKNPELAGAHSGD